MRRNVLTFACMFVGLALVLVGYFFLAAPWGADGVDNSDPRVEYAPLVTVVGVIMAFGSAVVYELLPDKDQTGDS